MSAVTAQAISDPSADVAIARIDFPAHDDWLSRQELDALTPAALVQRVRALKPLIAAHARQTEIDRRPSAEVWKALRKTGVFYHFVPKRYGGLEFGLEPFIDYILDVGEACASTAWVLGQCVEHNWGLAAYPKAAQDEIFGRFPYVIAPGVHAPPGKATPVEGGYRVTGHWQWGSGVMNADWVKANVLAPDPAGGEPLALQVVFPSEEATILDVWHMDGMAGTGSNDIVVKDLFVPVHRVLDVAAWYRGDADGALTHSNPVYRVPMIPFLSLTTMLPAIGATRATVARFREWEAARMVRGSDAKRTDRPASQMRLARAELMINSADMHVRDAARQMMDLAIAGDLQAFEPRARIRALNNYAMELCQQTMQLIIKGAGAFAHRLDNPMQRAWRDVHVMASHTLYDWDTTSELYGRALLGLGPNNPIW